MPKSKVILGDNREVMQKLPLGCIDLIVTSPPYFMYKYYEDNVGWDDFLELLKGSIAGMSRVIKEDGRVVLNFSDIGHFTADEKPYHKDMRRFYVDFAKEAGMHLIQNRIWLKTSLGWGNQGQVNFHRNDNCLTDWEWMLTFSKSREQRRFCSEIRINEEYGKWAGRATWAMEAGKETGIDKHFIGKKIGGADFAIFPLELPTRFIMMHTEKGDVVLDPFCGTGTTLVAAYKLGRNSIGIDKEEQAITISKKRLASVGQSWKRQ